MSSTDAIDLATQTGRLDFLTAILACITIIFVVGAFPAWFFIQSKAVKVAKEAVDEEIEDLENRIEAAAISRMEVMLPVLVKEYLELSRKAADSEEAEDFGQSQEDEEPTP